MFSERFTMQWNCRRSNSSNFATMAATPQEGAGGAPNEATNGNSPPTVAPSEADSDSSAVVVDAPPASPASDDGSEASAVLVAATPRPDADEEQSSTTPTPRRPAPRAPVEEEPGWLAEPELSLIHI